MSKAEKIGLFAQEVGVCMVESEDVYIHKIQELEARDKSVKSKKEVRH